jgi:hypothetical protein
MATIAESSRMSDRSLRVAPAAVRPVAGTKA